MSLFAEQPVHCPACGMLHSAPLGGGSSLAGVAGIHLCCDATCREALRRANARYILGQVAPHQENPIRELILATKDEKEL